MSDTLAIRAAAQTASQATIGCRVGKVLRHTEHTRRLSLRGAYRSAEYIYSGESPEDYGHRVAGSVRSWRRRAKLAAATERVRYWSEMRGAPPDRSHELAQRIARSRGITGDRALQMAHRAARMGMLVSVEMEFLARDGSPLQRSGYGFGSYPNQAMFTYDGSVKAADTSGVSRALFQEVGVTFEMGKVGDLYTTCGRLAADGGVVNKTCGLHVHIDARHLTRAQEATRRRHLVAALPWLLELVPASRRRNRYCWPNDVPFPPETNRRYRAINPTSYGKHMTTEIRLGAGSLDADKIMNWVTLLRWLSNTSKYYRTFDAFLGSDCPQEVKVWAVLRRAKFAGVTVEATEGSEA